MNWRADPDSVPVKFAAEIAHETKLALTALWYTLFGARRAPAGTAEPIFHPDALGALHEQSFGIPRRIGNIATQAMLYAMVEHKRTIDADMVLKVKTGG